MTDSLCGRPHYQHPETLCTEPAGHYQPDRDPHAGPLIIDGRQCGGAAWDEPKGNPMPEPQLPEPAPSITGYCPACGRGDAAPTADDWEQQRQRADTAEAALREVLAVAEVIDANGIKWAADSIRRAAGAQP
ncbi:hypothetical protein ACFY2M_19445 [Streptomyces sp. NPDC001276]|uniref:hypothetical protein n=1 Tax=Streptomyces sp. NPDC001276 TaxID=3364555 RepID=UPI0036861EA9